MLCPQCSVVMKMAFRDGIEIDYCPKCRGIWLDRGELDKLLDRTVDERRSERFIDNDDDSSEFYVTDNNPTEKRKRHTSNKKEYTKARKRPVRHKKSKKVSDLIEDIFDVFD